MTFDLNQILWILCAVVLMVTYEDLALLEARINACESKIKHNNKIANENFKILWKEMEVIKSKQNLHDSHTAEMSSSAFGIVIAIKALETQLNQRIESLNLILSNNLESPDSLQKLSLFSPDYQNAFRHNPSSSSDTPAGNLRANIDAAIKEVKSKRNKK